MSKEEVVTTEAGSSTESGKVEEVPAVIEENGEQAETIEMSREEFGKLKDQLVHSQTMLGKQSQDVGTSRARVTELESEVTRLTQTRNQLKDDGMADPFEAIETSNALTKAQTSLETENAKFIESSNRAVFARVDPAYEKRVDKMAEIMLKNGELPDAVQQFKANPYGVDQGIALAYLEAATSAQKFEEAQELINKLDPKNVAANIQAAAKGGAMVTASSGGGTSGEVEVTSEMLRSATSVQRKHFIKSGEWISPT